MNASRLAQTQALIIAFKTQEFEGRSICVGTTSR